MPIVNRTTLVTHSVDDIWAVLAAFGDISLWAPNVDHSCVVSDRMEGIGAVRRIQSSRATVLETVVEWDETVGFSYSISGLPPVVRSVTNSWNLEPNEAGTNVRLSTNIQAGPRPPHRLAAMVVGRRLGVASDQMLGGLDAFLNGRASAGQGAV